MDGIMAIADVIIVNYGLHYAGNVSEFEEAMPMLLKQARARMHALREPPWVCGVRR